MPDPLYDNLLSQMIGQPLGPAERPKRERVTAQDSPDFGTIGPAQPYGGSLPSFLGHEALAGIGDVFSAGGEAAQIPRNLMLEGAGALNKVSPYNPISALLTGGAAVEEMVGRGLKSTGESFSDWGRGYSAPIDVSESLTNPNVNLPQLLDVLGVAAPVAGKVPAAGRAFAEDFLRGELGRDMLLGKGPLGGVLAGIKDFHELRGPLPSTTGYVYHAATQDQINSWRQTGIPLHEPGSYKFTTWPDGSRTPRSWFTGMADNTYRTAPFGPPVVRSSGEVESGNLPAIVRVNRRNHPFKRDPVSGDLYTEQVVDPQHIEFMAQNQTWHPLVYPQSQIRHDIQQVGWGGRDEWRHTYEAAGGEGHGGATLVVYEYPHELPGTGRATRGTARVSWAGTHHAARGRDLMKALLKYAIRDMRSRGRTFFSDRMVSGLQQPSYYALGKEDYKVTERSHGPVGRVTPNEFRYADTSRGVFEVEPPIREQLDFSDLVQYPPFPSK